MSTSASAKIAKVRQRKMILIAVVVIIAIVAVSLVTYALIFAYVYNFHLSIVKATAPAELKEGSQTQVALIVHYNMMNNPYLKNHITLSLSGTAASWGSFVTANFFRNGTQTTPPITIATPSDGAVLFVKIPDDAQAGSYEITVTGTNSVGRTSSVTYAFIVTT
jgi:hypothetical protein